jgi:hypothetical protein
VFFFQYLRPRGIKGLLIRFCNGSWGLNFNVLIIIASNKINENGDKTRREKCSPCSDEYFYTIFELDEHL